MTFLKAKAAAEQGNAEAQWNLGFCYEWGKGVEQDSAEAVKWYRKAAEQGNTFAQFRLGDCYYSGKGVEKNHDQALKWYCKSAEHGNAYAQCVLGVCYAKGDLVEQDYKEAVKWFHKAAMQGHTDAQYNLGTDYRKGEGVKLDNVKAYAWYNLAAESNKAAAQSRNILEATMSPQQVTEGKYRTRELRIIIESNRLPETGEEDNQKPAPLTVDRAISIVEHAEDEFASGKRIEDAFTPFAAGGASTRLEARNALHLVIADFYCVVCARSSRDSDAMEGFRKYAEAWAGKALRITSDHLIKQARSSGKRMSELLSESGFGHLETVSSFVDFLQRLNPEATDYWPNVYQRMGLDYPREPVCHPEEIPASIAKKPWWRFW